LPADGLSFATALHQSIRADPSLPAIRIGIHTGQAIYRGGDYISTTVNVASRVTSAATGGETLITDTVAEQT